MLKHIIKTALDCALDQIGYSAPAVLVGMMQIYNCKLMPTKFGSRNHWSNKLNQKGVEKMSLALL